MPYSTVTLGGITLNILGITPKKELLTDKQVNGRTLTETKIVGIGAQQNRLVLSGIITGTSASMLDTNRAAVLALDDVSTHSYTDGKYDGTYYVVPGKIEFNDSGEDVHSIYKYTIEIVEE